MAFDETRLARHMLFYYTRQVFTFYPRDIYIQTYAEEMYILAYVWFPDEQFSKKMRSKFICFSSKKINNRTGKITECLYTTFPVMITQRQLFWLQQFEI